MKVVEYNSSGHVFKINVPSTVEEYDKLADKAGACLDAAIDHEVFHGTLGDIREAFADLVAEEFKTPRREVGTGKFVEEDGKKVEVLATEKTSTFLERVAAEKNLDLATKPFQKVADRLSAGGDKAVNFDPKAQKRSGLGPVLAKTYRENAAKFLADAKSLPKVLKNLGKVLGKEVVVTGNTDEEKATSLGWQLKAYAVEMEKRNAASLAA